MNINTKTHSLTFLLLMITSAAYAKDERVEHDAHEHGVAEINIVWDKADLNIELLSPAFNITGFEYQPANHEQEEAIEKIEKKLNAPNELFLFTGASCKTVNTKIESPFEEHDDHEKHEEKDHDDDHDKDKDHDDHKKDEKQAKHDDHEKHEDKDEHAKHDDDDEHKEDEKHDDHKEHADHDKHKESTHSEYNISYVFNCANSKTELSIDAANLFKHFPNMEKINIQWLSATQQSSAILTKKNNTINLK